MFCYRGVKFESGVVPFFAKVADELSEAWIVGIDCQAGGEGDEDIHIADFACLLEYAAQRFEEAVRVVLFVELQGVNQGLGAASARA